jgi:hypothetical protein
LARKIPAVSEQATVTLTDADITAERSVTRRSLLGALGIGAGAAATVMFATPQAALAADSSKKKKSKKTPKKPKEETDKD